ncbi:DNA/RNA helicase domain-containing protein [Gemmatimonadota bacterium]
MIVYSATRREFTEDVFSNQIEDRILEAFQSRRGVSFSRGEVSAWKNSMQYMNNLLVDGEIPEDAGVAIEYNIPQTAKRIDFILTGQDTERHDTAVIVELKQWTEARLTDRDGIVETYVGGAQREVPHPSYQAWTYAALIADFNETVQDEEIQLVPCAYLHNCITPEVIHADAYRNHTILAPAFIKADTEKLKMFLQQYVRYGDSNQILYRIENGRIRPSKNLADHLESLLSGNREFVLVDDQKVVFEKALSLNKIAQDGKKQVLIVEGGPGTGKSVVAINLLVELTNQRLVAQYVTRNAAPRAVYESKLSGTLTKTHITNLFKSSGAFMDCDRDVFNVLIVDEAHRLNEKSGFYQNQGENQITEIIQAAKLSIFFIDEDQRITFKDIGEVTKIREWAEDCGAEVHQTALESQFRCNGSDGYLAWVDHVLQIRTTANESLEDIEYDFRIFDDPNELYRQIVQKNQRRNKARLVAGYCWDWKGKKDPNIRDVTIPEHDFAMRWNLASDGSLWLVMPESVNEIGCIHTCQGLELDYIGVIIGADFVVRNGEVRIDAGERSSQDSSIRGYKSMLKDNPEQAQILAERVVKNTYRTLMTRGQNGCYIYCVDAETNEYFKELAYEGTGTLDDDRESYPGLSLRVLATEDVIPFENCVPIFNLEIAAGSFSEEQHVDEHDWVELPDSFRNQPGHFVARVVGESMNRRIPNGSWCLFKNNIGGSREGKVVIVEHRDIQDPDTGTSCTVKVYSSQKSESGDSWEHEAITLSPDSTVPGYRPIELSLDDTRDLRVIGELVAILS